MTDRWKRMRVVQKHGMGDPVFAMQQQTLTLSLNHPEEARTCKQDDDSLSLSNKEVQQKCHFKWDLKMYECDWVRYIKNTKAIVKILKERHTISHCPSRPLCKQKFVRIYVIKQILYTS